MDGTAGRHERATDFLTEGEVAGLLEGAKAGRYGLRDHLRLLMVYRHALRASEAVGLRRDALDLDRARLQVHRVKGSLSAEHPVAQDELRAAKRYLATRSDALPWLFLSERGQPLNPESVNDLTVAAAARAGLPAVHPGTLRRSCGHTLTNKGYNLRFIQGYLGLRDPRHAARYARQAGTASRDPDEP